MKLHVMINPPTKAECEDLSAVGLAMAYRLLLLAAGRMLAMCRESRTAPDAQRDSASLPEPLAGARLARRGRGLRVETHPLDASHLLPDNRHLR